MGSDHPAANFAEPVLSRIPDWEKYLTVDQINEEAANLADAYPGRVELMDLGKSTEGESIHCLKVGDGKFNALIHGFPDVSAI